MAVVPIISQSWDTNSYFNPTRMNTIETNISTLSKATGIEYSSGVSVKDMLTPTEIMSANTSDYVTYARQVGKIIFFSFFAKREFTPSSPIVQIPVYVGGEVNINDASQYSYPQKLKIQSNGNVIATDTVIKNQAFYLMTFIIP